MKDESYIDSLKRYLSPKGFSETQWYTVFVLVMAVLLIGWVSVMSLLGFSVSFLNILYIHHFLFVWIFDLVIIALPLLVLYLNNFKRINLGELNEKVDDLTNQISSSIVIAGKIGQGQVLDTKAVQQSSELQRTLMNLGKNLQQTKEKELQFSWVSKGKETISDILRKNTKIDDLAYATLVGIVEYYEAVQGAFYLYDGKDTLKTACQYAYNRRRYEQNEVKVGRGLVGAVAYEKKLIYRTEVPDDYFTITSGLVGDQKPKCILILPLLQEKELQGIIEISFLKNKLPQHYLSLAEELGNVVGATLYNLKINQRTEELLEESQEMTATLKKNEVQLQQNAREMMIAQENLEISNKELAVKIEEVELGQKKLQALLMNASEFISIYNEERESTFESPSIKRILGYDAEDTVHGLEEDMMTPKGWKTICQMFDYLLSTPGGETEVEYTYVKKSGEKIFLQTQGKNLLHDPAIRGLVMNTRDITERKRAEKEERMKSRMQSLAENSPDMILRTSANGKIVYSNPILSKFLGFSTAQLINTKVSSIENPEAEFVSVFVNYIVERLMAVKQSHKQEVGELKLIINKKTVILEVKSIPEFNEGNSAELESILFTAHDVTEVRSTLAKVEDSINYGKRIQMAIMPSEQVIQRRFQNSFMYYRPKDVVSGDFPWYFEWGNVYYVAAVDCTGHGVPGSILSIIGYLMLTNIVNHGHDLTAADILTQLHESVKRTLRQDEDGANSHEGMDMGLCRIDTDKREIQYAGARRPLFYLRNGELEEYKATVKGIGGASLPGKPEKDFVNNVIEYQAGDRFFLFSDGLTDQRGGTEDPSTKKFQAKRVRELVTGTAQESMAGVSRAVTLQFGEWMSTADHQDDDILLIGMEMD